MKTLLLLASVVLAAATQPEATSFNGAQVLRVVPQTEQHIDRLQKLLHEDNYDFWMGPSGLDKPTDIMAIATQLPELTAYLQEHGMESQVLISDVGQAVEKQMDNLPRLSSDMDWTNYHDYDTINSWIARLASDYPDVCSVEVIGKSYEKRVMNMLTVGTGGTDRPAIFIEGGVHGREWISPATVTYMINELVTNSSQYEDLLANVTFYFIPVSNPDGYEFSRSSPLHRLWSKTRSATVSTQCVGADPNRNWDIYWGVIGTSNDPCSNGYPGREPFSEVEVRLMRDQLMRFAKQIKVFLSFRSYGQMWMYPWGYTKVQPIDLKELKDLAQDAVRALAEVYDTTYFTGAVHNAQHPVSGSSVDWAKAYARIKYSYSVLLRDKDTYILEADQIIPTGVETFEALKVVANFVKTTYCEERHEC